MDSYRISFLEEMKIYDDNPHNVSSYLNNTQTHLSCCGYNGPRDYKEFFKPVSCCDDDGNAKMDTKQENFTLKCLSPPLTIEGNIGQSPKYFEEGCSVKVNMIFQKYHGIFLGIGVLGLIFMTVSCFVFMWFLMLVFLSQSNQGDEKKPRDRKPPSTSVI